ncbi:MAG: GNAT family N-acetyltransferase, partial [Spirochaetes bacterium]|nr:GNAT family N-acetyltransferase [Spirochaetota bacterium]
VTGKKIGSIILLAVRKEFRGKNHIAENLVQTVLTLFLQYQFNMVMVGTDADNLPAVFIYLKTGFKPYFQWGTFRYHYQGPFLKSSLKIEKVGPDDKKTMRKFISLIDRPFSLVHDRTLKPHVNGLLKYMSEKAQEEIQQGKSELVCVKEKNKVLAYYTFAEQKGISRVLGKKFFRINDLVFLNKNHDKSIKSMHAFLKYLSMKEASILEVFIRINDWPGIKVLCQSGFTLVHMTTTLHKHLK